MGKELMFAPYPSRRRIMLAALVIVLVETVMFGAFIRKIGFYQDDWAFFDMVVGQTGFWDRVDALRSIAYRTMAMLSYAFVFSFGGMKPLFYQVFLAVQDALGGILFYLFLGRVLGSPGLALTAAAFAVAYPVRPASHHWLSCTTQGIAQNLILGSMLLHQSWLETRKRGLLAASMAAYAVAFTGYEALCLLPLCYGAALFSRAVNAGRKPYAAAVEAAKAIAPYGAALIVCAFWRRVGAPAVFHIVDPQKTHISVSGILGIYRDGFNCITWDALKLCRITFAPALELLDDPSLLLLALFALLAGRLLQAHDDAPPERGAYATAAWIAVAGYAGVYLPYAVAGYEPTNVGIMSRINGGGALVGGVLSASLLWALAGALVPARPKPAAVLRQALLTFALAAFTWTNWYVAAQWAASWKMQTDALDKVAAKIGALPGPMVILLKDAPEYINGTAVFYKHWGWDAALRVRTGRKDLHGDILMPWMISGPKGLVDARNSPPNVLYPYPGVYVYDYPADKLVRVVN